MQRGAPCCIHADEMTGLVQGRMHRRVVPQKQALRDQPGLRLTPVTARDRCVHGHLLDDQTVGLQAGGKRAVRERSDPHHVINTHRSIQGIRSFVQVPREASRYHGGMDIDKSREIVVLASALMLLLGSGAALADGSNGASPAMPGATPGSGLQPWQNQAGTTAEALGMAPGAAGLAGSGAGAAGLGSTMGGTMGSAMGSSLGGNAMLDQGMGEGLSGSSTWSNQAGQLEQKLATGTGGDMGSLDSSADLGSGSAVGGSPAGSTLPSRLRGPSSLNGGMQLPAYRYGGNVAGQTHPFPQGGAHIQSRYGLHMPNPQCTGIYPARGC
jgi:hypothetical protein